MDVPDRRPTPSSTRILFLGLLFLLASIAVFQFAASANRQVADRVVLAAAEMEQIKPQLEQANPPLELLQRYNTLLAQTSDCLRVTEAELQDGHTSRIANNLCINGSFGVGDPTFNRPLANSAGNGFGGSCTPSGSATAVFHDRYTFNLFGCSTFPTQVTFSLCGPAGCTAAASVDTVMILYRRVSAGDGLTANGSLPASFSSSAPCTNARALNDDTGATPTAAGGSTCDQLNTSDCTASCSPSTSISQMKRSLGSGLFTLVVTTFANGSTGNYNLYVNAPAAGCTLSIAPTAADGAITGRVMTASGIGVSKATVQVTDQSGQVRAVNTNGFGYYQIDDLETGQIYVVTVLSKRYSFAPQSVELTNAIQGVDFTAAP